MREIHSAALEDTPLLDDARDPAAALGTVPGVATECAAIDRFEARHDARLQVGKIGSGACEVHGRSQDANKGGSECNAAWFSAYARGDGAMADVSTVLHAVEVNRTDRAVSGALRLPNRLAERSHAEHPATARYDRLARERRPRVEDFGIFLRRAEAGDRVALPGLVRIAGRGQHDSQRSAAIPFRFDAVELSVERVLYEVDQVRLEPHHDRLRFRIAHTAIEFERAGRARGIDHDASVEEAR